MAKIKIWRSPPGVVSLLWERESSSYVLNWDAKGGTLLVFQVVTPLTGMKKPQLPICKAIYRGYNFIYKDRRGPLCSWDEISNSNAMSS